VSLVSQIVLGFQAVGGTVKALTARVATLEGIGVASNADILAGTDATKRLTSSNVVNAQAVTELAKVQFIPNGGTVTGTPGPYTLIIELDA
jgi:hypothetical protein